MGLRQKASNPVMVRNIPQHLKNRSNPGMSRKLLNRCKSSGVYSFEAFFDHKKRLSPVNLFGMLNQFS